jgi:hypothetical protein
MERVSLVHPNTVMMVMSVQMIPVIIQPECAIIPTTLLLVLMVILVHWTMCARLVVAQLVHPEIVTMKTFVQMTFATCILENANITIT